MTELVCSQCNATVELVQGLTACPHCQQDLRRQIAQAKQLSLKAQMDQEEIQKKEKEDTLPYPRDQQANEKITLEEDIEHDESTEPNSNDVDLDSELDAEFNSDEDNVEDDDDFDFEIETTELSSESDAKTMLDTRFANIHDPMQTLPIPEIDDEKTLGVSDQTLQASDEGENEDDFLVDNPSIQVDLEAVDPLATLVVQPEEPDRTIINPQAAMEAAEKYSQGLNTVIPPRTISRESSPGQTQDYTVEKRLGAGAFGVVFRAVQVPLERKVAVKVLQDTDGISNERRQKLKNEFLREAQFTGRLEHPNIVPIHDIGLTVTPSGRANPFYAMKEIRGVSWLDSIRTATRRDNLNVFKNVANAIGFSHDSNIVHCDLKPDNVMVGEFGEVLVVDWGQAVDLADETTMRPGGTPAYISPEMAQYWCDIHLDKKDDSPARQLVGFRTDVYLLGALLFEIVTGSPPHCGENNDSPYEVIRLAAENVVVNYEAHANDELLQIALRAMRLGEKEPIETVVDLLAALEVYENRISSIELRQRAYEILEQAKANSDYDEFQRARFGFEESLEKWSGNALSRKGLLDARLSSARLALKDQNFDLGIGILEGSQTSEENEVKADLESGKSKRDRRKKLVRYLALGLLSSIIVGILVNGYMINRNVILVRAANAAVDLKTKAETATRIAELAKSKIEREKNDIEQLLDPLKDELEKNKEEIKQFSTKLKQAESEYDRQLAAKQAELGQQLAKEKANFDSQLNLTKAEHELKLEAEQKQNAIRLADEKKKFEAETRQLVEQKQVLNQQVAQLNESSKLLRYKSDVTNVVQKLQSGDYRETRKLIDRFADKTPWEVARLNLLAHREIEAIYPNSLLEAFAASADGSRFALVFADQVEIRNTNEFNRALLAIPIQGATAVAFSRDGNQIAIGKPADSNLKPGEIRVFDISNPAAAKEARKLDAQSLMITQLAFSFDDSRLLSVGSPSKLRKSSGNVSGKELMIWENGSPIEVKLIAENGQLPKFTKATFSNNGKRILTTRPNVLPNDQVVHVFEQRGEAFQWIETSPPGINAAAFEDDNGSSIVGSARDNQSGTYSLVSWRLNQPSVTKLVSISTANVDSIRTVAQLDKMAISIRRYGDLLVTSGQDRKGSIWDWKTKTRKRYGGHAHDIDHCILRPGQSNKSHVLVSVSLGESPEILKTDLATYMDEVEEIQIGEFTTTDAASPSTFSRSQVTGQMAFGNDLGQASVVRNGQRIQWEITAWKNHVLADQFLFAQSTDDYLYQFNRQSGALERVLTRLSASFEKEIVKLEVSDDGKTALIVSDDQEPAFHLWDLEQDQKIRTVNYGAEDVFKTGTQKELLAMTLSPNGEWVIGGKVGVFAWSTQSGQRIDLTKSSPEMARSPVSSIVFLDQGERFLVSWKDRVDLFDLSNLEDARRFNTSQFAYDKNEPNLLDARVTGNKILVLARSKSTTNQDSGIILADLQSGKTLATFDSARFATFSSTEPEVVFIVNKPSSKGGDRNVVEKWSASTNQRQAILNQQRLDAIFDGRFRSVEKVAHDSRGLTLQTTTKSRNSSIQRDWSTISINPDLTLGAVRVFAKPKIHYHATAGDRAITLEQGTIRFWSLSETSVQPDGMVPGLFQTCRLSPDEKSLIAVPFNSNLVMSFDPQSGKEQFAFRSTDPAAIESIAWNANSNEIALGSQNGSVEFLSFQGDQWRSLGRVQVADTPISELFYSDQSQALLVTSKASGTAHVLRRHQETWKHFSLAHVDGRQIMTGDISSDGNRVITGSANGQLTIWNTEPSADSATETNDSSTQERELYDLQNKHQSPISFAKFLIEATGESNIVSAESRSDKNEIVIWKTRTPGQ